MLLKMSAIKQHQKKTTSFRWMACYFREIKKCLFLPTHLQRLKRNFFFRGINFKLRI